MNSERINLVEGVQRIIVTLIATHPAGHRLCLIGGYRYRLLSQSCRTSVDIDYHWDGNLSDKQEQLVELLTKRLIPEVKRQFGYDGHIQKATGPDADSPFVKTVLAIFYRMGDRPDRLEMPVEITSIPCLDRPIVRTVSGTVILTASDADMVEGKVIALFGRTFVEARDIIDLFLFRDHFLSDSSHRVKEKFKRLAISAQAVAGRFRSLVDERARYERLLDRIIADQVEDAVAANLVSAGGGAMIMDEVLNLLCKRLDMPDGVAS